jgi:hypothetical protein
MSEATPQAHEAAKTLSPQARKLLAQLSNSGAPLGSALDDGFDSVMDAPGPDVPEMLTAPAPVLLTPHSDSKASAFADLLGHIDDGSDAMMVDEKAALAVAEKYRSEKQAANIAFDDDDLLDEFAGDDAEARPAFDAPLDEALTPLTDAEIDAALGDDPFGEHELDEAEKRGRFSGLMSRFRAGAGGVKQLIGVRNAAAAYDAQSGASLLPFTIIRAIILVLVAAVPPAVNLAIIQPQISDNSRKLTQIRSFEAQMAENKKIADKLATRLSALEQDAKRRIDKLMPNEDLERLFNSYVAALQKYDIDLRGYNVSALGERKVIIGNRVQEASLVELDLAGRYDVYVDIRRIFIDQLKIATVVNETMVPQEDDMNLLIKASLMVPTKREYDAELDDPSKQAAEAKP